MKTLFIPFLTALLLSTGAQAQFSFSGTSDTEQAAKLELIRILNERMNKLSTAQMNSRVIVSRGVSTYYKVDEIMRMKQDIYGYRSKYVSIAGNLEKANPGFAATGGNGFAYRYMTQYNRAVETANTIAKQLQVVITSGQPIILPAMPTISVYQSSGSSVASGTQAALSTLNNQYGINTADDYNALYPEKKAEYDSKWMDLSLKLKGELQADIAKGDQKLLGILGNVVGAAFGAPMAGTLIMSVVQSAANGGGVASLIGTITDTFQVPLDYYDSPTLKLTDAERIKMIDELHLRISETYQQVAALGASMSTETSKRYNELSQPRNEMIMYGPKK